VTTILFGLLFLIQNSVNYHPHAIESAIEAANISGVTPSFTVVFAHRPKGSETESLVVVYLPSYDISDPFARVQAAGLIFKVVVTHCGSRPFMVLPLDERFLQKSSLGKLARAKIRKEFEDGIYDDQIETDRMFRTNFKDKALAPATTVIESTVVGVCNHILNTMDDALIGTNDDLFMLGISSIDLLQLRLHLQTHLKIPEIPITIFFSHPQIGDLALALAELKSKHTSYDPIVTLQPHGSKTPLFLIHPGVGEILVFMNLARHLTDRPVYAIRARGFDGEPYFTSFAELITTYHSAIKRIQPHGPYALLGYSFGSIAAFEITKVMEGANDEVKMLAILDQAPFFKERARGYDWYEVAMTISFFLSLITEEFAYAAIPAMRLLSHSQVLDIIFTLAPKARLEELGMTREKLDNWAKLALQLKKIVWDYDPKGIVSKMDVFYTGPLVGLVKANTTEEWFRGFISKWGAFVKEGGVSWFEVGGTHRSMITPPHLEGFVRVFKRVLEERGL
jgi:thioesterase domain-containing protein